MAKMKADGEGREGPDIKAFAAAEIAIGEGEQIEADGNDGRKDVRQDLAGEPRQAGKNCEPGDDRQHGAHADPPPGDAPGREI
jgi:hypothetical protein